MLNEEGLAAEFCARTTAALADLPHEIVVVDDGSSDATPAILDGRIYLRTEKHLFVFGENAGAKE